MYAIIQMISKNMFNMVCLFSLADENGTEPPSIPYGYTDYLGKVDLWDTQLFKK